MDNERFWSIIEQSRRNDVSNERQIKELADILRSYSPEELIAFESLFALLRNRAYCWDLWAVAYLIEGGCSDDGFDYFRCWLIAQGQAIYESALRDPESLLEVLSEAGNEEIDVEFEEFGSVCRSVYEEKTGQDMGKLPVEQAEIAEPFGKSWTEDDLPLRFPRAWQRFGVEFEDEG